MKKVRILICHSRMVVGGIEAALLNLMKRLDPDLYDIDLLLIDDKGEFFDRIPKYVNIFFDENIKKLGNTPKQVFFHELKKFRLVSAVKILFCRLKHSGDPEVYYGCCVKKMPRKQYDIAINYNNWASYFALYIDKCVKAKEKLFFLHNEPVYNRCVEEGQYPIRGVEKTLAGYTRLVGVSDSVTKKFAELLPQYAEKCCTIYNFIDVEQIKAKAREFYPKEFSTQTINILSVGRLVAQKNFIVIPEVCKILLESNVKFKWFIVGDGPQKDTIKAEIGRNNLSDNVVLLGTKLNPYPYFKYCDVYCQTSISEAYCITVAEARIFKKLVVSTEFMGIDEQLNNGEGGIIVENNSNAIAAGLIKALTLDECEKEKYLECSEFPNLVEKNSADRFFKILNNSMT